MGWTTWPALAYSPVPVGDLSPRFYRESSLSPRFSGGRTSLLALYFLYSFVVRAPRQSRVYGM